MQLTQAYPAPAISWFLCVPEREKIIVHEIWLMMSMITRSFQRLSSIQLTHWRLKVAEEGGERVIYHRGGDKEDLSHFYFLDASLSDSLESKRKSHRHPEREDVGNEKGTDGGGTLTMLECVKCVCGWITLITPNPNQFWKNDFFLYWPLFSEMLKSTMTLVTVKIFVTVDIKGVNLCSQERKKMSDFGIEKHHRIERD